MSLYSVIAALFARKGEVKNITYTDNVMDAFGVGPSSAAGVAITASTAMRVSAVYACVQRIAGAVASLPLHTYARDADGGRSRIGLPVWWLLNEQPTERYSAAAHWEKILADILLRGDSFTWIRRDSLGNVRELVPLPWTSVDVVRDLKQAGGMLRYYVNDSAMKTTIEATDMLHFPGLGFDGIRSLSVISYAARNAAGTALAMDEYAGKFFAGGAHPSMVLHTEGKMGPDQIAKLQAAFAAKYSGVENAHKLPLILTEGIKAEALSISAHDSQLLEARRFQVVDIARAFGVPPHMIGETTAATSWGSGIEAMSRGFVTYTLQPHLIRLEQEINRKLWPKREKYFVEFNRDALLEGDSAAQAAYFRAAIGGPGTGCGWMAVDEIRKIKNLPAVGGDFAEIYDPREISEPATPAADAAYFRAAIAAEDTVEPDANTRAQVASQRYAADISKEVAEINAKAVREAPPPVINVAAPVVNVTTPDIKLEPTINVAPAAVTVEPSIINVAPPEVTLEAILPTAPAPTVNVAPPIVNVEAPEINVNLPARKTTTDVVRDASGRITKTTQLETDA